jgi:hypothetical protein
MSDMQHEAYRPAIEDGRGIFPEDFRVKAPASTLRAPNTRDVRFFVA